MSAVLVMINNLTNLVKVLLREKLKFYTDLIVKMSYHKKYF